jgi:uncharacterized membrane protein
LSSENSASGETPTLSAGRTAPRRRLDRLLFIFTAVVILVTLVLPHGDVPERLNYLGRAVCGQLPEHSLFCGEQQLPHCARCTGTYLGALVTYVVLSLMGRGRSNGLPPLRILLLLFVFIALWAVDGLNSYVALYTNRPLLYAPSNLLRLISGLLQGTALMVIVRPIVALTLLKDSQDEPVVDRHRDLLRPLAAAALVGLVAQTGVAWLYYPLAFLSLAGQILMLTLVNALVACIVLRREALATGWRQTAVLWAVGLAAALVEITAINLVRDALGRLLGLPI